MLAVLALGLWLLLRNQVTVATGETTCNPGEYEVPGHPSCNTACPAGYYVSRPISQDYLIGACSQCESGTFRAHPSLMTQCMPCTPCREDQEVVKNCSTTSDQVCQCQRGNFFCDSLDCPESCRRCKRCKDSAVLRPCNATSNTICAKNPQSGNPGLPRTHIVVILIVVLIIVVITIIALYLYDVKYRRTGNRNELSRSSPGTRQSGDLEKGPPAPGKDISLELVRNSAPLASEGPGDAEPLQGANGSLAVPGEQTRMLEAPRTAGQA